MSLPAAQARLDVIDELAWGRKRGKKRKEKREKKKNEKKRRRANRVEIVSK